MALYLLYRTRPEDRIPTGQHSAVVQAANEATARALARVAASWAALPLAGLAYRRVLRFEGDAISMLGWNPWRRTYLVNSVG